VTPVDHVVFGLEAFAAGYASARGLELEDPDELRRRIALPFPGYPEYCMRGRLAQSVEGRLVLWLNHLDMTERPYVNVALVPARAGADPAPTPPFELALEDGWLVVAERVDAAGRSVARLDALATEVTRLAT
jgi:hypothetical protein